MSQDLHPDAGFGIGLRPAHYDAIIKDEPALDWLEIISENFMAVGGRARQRLLHLRDRYPIAMHGVGLNIAGLGPLDRDYLRHLRALAQDLQPFLVTDHLCWTAHAGAHSYDLLPFPLTRRMLQHVAGRVQAVQEWMGTALLLENPSYYVRYGETEMSEAEFLAELCQMTGCGVLLDINNLYVNECNLGISASSYLEALPSGVVRQFHVAGHSCYPDIRIDTHDHAACPEVWALYRQAVRRWPAAATLYEWDDALPSLPDFLAELAVARSTWQAAWNEGVERAAALAPPLMPRPMGWGAGTGIAVTRQAAMEALWQLLSHPIFPKPQVAWQDFFRDDLPVTRERGLQVYQQGYFLRLRDACRSIFPTLAYVTQEAGFERLLAAYFSRVTESAFSLNLIGEGLAAFLAEEAVDFDYGVSQEVLAALARFEWNINDLYLIANEERPRWSATDLLGLDEVGWMGLRFDLAQDVRLHASPYPVMAVWEACAAEEVPERPVAQPSFYLLVRGSEGHVSPRVTDDVSFRALASFAAGQDLAQVLEGTVGAEHAATWLASFVTFVVGLADEGLLVRATP